MIKQTVAYTNLDGQPATEDLYFNLNKAELIDLELEQDRSCLLYTSPSPRD